MLAGELIEECGDGDIEAAAELEEREHAGIALAAFDAADVVEMDAGEFGELPERRE